jgi:pimeloyl-ACP methyl ester carboxylesterase
MPYATASDGVRLYYEELGAGEPLLLISGQASDHTSWGTVPNGFADQYHVIAFDHRGIGLSDKPTAPPYSTQGFADDAIALLDHLQITRAHAYGVSMGGRVCQ